MPPKELFSVDLKVEISPTADDAPRKGSFTIRINTENETEIFHDVTLRKSSIDAVSEARRLVSISKFRATSHSRILSPKYGAYEYHSSNPAKSGLLRPADLVGNVYSSPPWLTGGVNCFGAVSANGGSHDYPTDQ
jgi:hypothetical protein